MYLVLNCAHKYNVKWLAIQILLIFRHPRKIDVICESQHNQSIHVSFILPSVLNTELNIKAFAKFRLDNMKIH